MAELTTQEKIDYIYDHIKTEKRLTYWRIFFKIVMYICIIGYMYYFYAYWFTKLVDKVTDSLTPTISSEWIVDSVKNSWNSLLNSATINSIKEKYLSESENGDNTSNKEDNY